MSRSRLVLCRVVAMSALLATSHLGAQNIYWNGTGSTWNSAADWWDTPGGANNPAGYSGPTIVANFNAANVTAAQSITLDASQVIQGLVFSGNDTGGESITSGSGTNTLTIGPGGILDALGSGPDTIGSKLQLAGPQTWTNNSTNTLTISGGASLAVPVTSPTALTINGSGTTTLSGALSNGGGAGASLAVLKDGSGLVKLNYVQTYTGATIINNGVLQTNVANTMSGTLAGSPTITVNAGGTLLGGATDSLGFAPGIETITLNGGTLSETTGTIRQTIINTLTMIGGTVTAPAGSGDSGGSYSFIQGITATSDAAGNPAIINATNILLEQDHFGSLNDRLTVPIFVTRGPGSVDLSISSVILGFLGNPIIGGGENMGFTKNGDGIMLISGRNLYPGTTTINRGSLIAAETSGTPLGTANIVLNGGTLKFAPSGSSGNVSIALANNSTAVPFSYSGGGTLALNRNQASSLTVTVGSGFGTMIQRSGRGTLTIAPAGGTGTLGVSQFFKVSANATNPTVVNGLVNTSIVGQNDDASLSADFLNYDTSNGFIKATYSAGTNINAAGPTAVYNANSSGNGTNNNTLSAAATVYALNTAGQTIAATGRTLTVGNNSTAQVGVIFNGGQINGGTLAFGPSEATIYTSLPGGSISSAITGANGLTKFGPGTLTLTGAETYSGDTTIDLGTLTFGIGSSLTSTGTMTVGAGGDVAALVVNGGAVSVGTLNLTESTTASVNIVAGSLAITSTFNYLTNGVIVQSGGTFSAGGFVMSNGALHTPSTYYLGGGSATFSQTGSASLLVGASVNVGAFYVSQSGALIVNGDGTLNANRGNGVRNNLTVGNTLSSAGGQNIVVQQGGTVTANMTNSANPGLSILSGGRKSSYYLNGGTLTTNGVEASAGSNFYFGGGTFTPGVSGESVPIGATINAAGAVFDTSGNDMTWSGSLVAGTTGNVTSYANLVGGSGYTTAPTVAVSGGGGTGATAVAIIQGGAVLDVIITNPGSGYITPPSFNFSGGGGSGAAATSLITPGPGGLTKIGAGKLTLSGANTYAGDTTLANGTLEIVGAPSLGANSNVNVNGGTLRFNVTPASSGIVAVGSGVTANVTNSGVLELAGSLSALSAGGNRAHVANDGSAPAGLLVSGTNQQVGAIDGSGTTQVNAGSDLTANHIIQAALAIGGTATSHGAVTIAASDPSGTSLGGSQASDLGAGSLTPDGPSHAVSNGDRFQASGPPSSSVPAVPEPATIVLEAIACLGGLHFAVRRVNGGWKPPPR